MAAKRGLGRGLGALIPGADHEEESAAVAEIEISRVSKNPYQPRAAVGGAEFEELVDSVRRHGVLQPIIVRPVQSGYQVVAGERRWRAARDAGLTTIPAVVKHLADREMLELALVENLRRENLNPIERASAYKRLGDEFGLTQEQISDMVGSSRSAVANSLRLLDLPAEVRASLSHGRLSEGHGRALLGLAGEADILRVWRLIEERGLSVRETEELAKKGGRNVSRETMSRSRAKSDPQCADLAAQLHERYVTEVAISGRGKRGTIKIAYYSQDDLERLIDILLR